MKDNRKYPRQEISIDVVVKVNDNELVTLKTADVSEGGIFLLAGDHSLPEVDSSIEVTLSEFMGSDKPYTAIARIVRKTEEGIGIEFVTTAVPSAYLKKSQDRI